MKGYIIKSGKYYLAGRKGILYWFQHEKDVEAWVHPESILKELTPDKTADWHKKPKIAILAKYENDIVEITGKPFKI